MSDNRKLLSRLFALNSALGGDSLDDIIYMSKVYQHVIENPEIFCHFFS